MNIAQGSLEECQYYLILAKDLGYRENDDLKLLINEVSKMLESTCKKFYLLISRFLYNYVLS
jgi:four helix bundle protein